MVHLQYLMGHINPIQENQVVDSGAIASNSGKCRGANGRCEAPSTVVVVVAANGAKPYSVRPNLILRPLLGFQGQNFK
ncbi:hypothetical protein MTR_8g005215 [Medicago truncatula]|uniref:Uncharacterized protein n=1 Tax=Medicago truncatula TaxID=3880 RepID=A0A072TKP2_MEDTR|nr:hypothetical protein MTR_8g005215 [Medicago truncatula]